MKKRTGIIIILSAVLILILGIFITALYIKNTNKPKVTFPENYTVITSDNISYNSDFIELLGYSEESFGKYLRQNNIVSFAANENNGRQFLFSVYETDLSKQLGDISGKTDSELEVIGNAIFGKTDARIIRSDAEAFFEITTAVTDEDLEYCTVQYVTIRNGKYYTLNYHGSEPQLSDSEYNEIRSVLGTLTIPREKGFAASVKTGGATQIFYSVFIGVLTLVGAVLIVLLSVSLIRDLRRNRNGRSKENFKIKRRKKF